MIMHIDITAKNSSCVMIVFDDYPATATGFLGTNLPKAMKFFIVFVGATGQLARTNINALLEPKGPPGHC